MGNLKEVIISITNRCNFKCRMCDIPTVKMEELPAKRWKHVIKDASLIGAKTIVFSGGEPLLRQDIFELISFVKNNSMTACITSNGYLIDEDCASRLSHSGVGVVNVSLEGPRDIHDYLRGRGMFDRAISALENLKKHKIETTIATMVSRNNYKYLNYIVEAAKEYAVTTIKFQPFSEIFLNDGINEDDFFISYKQAKELEQLMQDLVSYCDSHGIATNPRPYLEKLPSYLCRKYFKLKNACSALWSSCPINAKGEVFPCWAFAQEDKLIGDVSIDNLLNIWGSFKHVDIIEKIKQERCLGCMMSCYDENFGKETIERRVVINVKKLKVNGPYEYLKLILRRWKRRLKFYSSYRGSLLQISNRIKGLFIKRKRLFIRPLKQDEIEKALKEISFIKQIIKKEIECHREK